MRAAGSAALSLKITSAIASSASAIDHKSLRPLRAYRNLLGQLYISVKVVKSRVGSAERAESRSKLRLGPPALNRSNSANRSVRQEAHRNAQLAAVWRPATAVASTHRSVIATG
jgi:hypothetical protein